jgi:hypothetical protein
MGKPKIRKHIFESECMAKVKHDSKHHAEAAIRAVKKKPDAAPSQAYRCTFCQGWHVGKASNR